jgi:membrane associated rhomboid family serine protease
MRPSRRQTQPFTRLGLAGRPTATAILVALGVGAGVSQMVITFMLRDQEGGKMLWQWLALDRESLGVSHYWKFLSFPFLHHDPVHWLINMTLLFCAGREIEPIIGGRHLFGIYGMGTLTGGLAHVFAMPQVPLVGACAGVVAVFTAFCTIMPELEVTIFQIPMRLRARHLAAAVVLMNVVLWSTFSLPMIGPAAMLAGGFAGWAYVKQLGFGNPLPIQRYIFEKRERAARLERMSPEQFMVTQIDPILEKIARDGLHSLTRAERKILVQGGDKLAAKASQK